MSVEELLKALPNDLIAKIVVDQKNIGYRV